MTMAQTSLDAYEKVKATRNEALVKEVVETLQPVTNEQIARALDWEINRVTGRTNGLEKKSLIARLDRKGVTKAGNSATRWVLVDSNDRQLRLI